MIGLQYLLMKYNIKNKDLCEKLGVTEKKISIWFNKQSNIQPWYIKKIKELFDEHAEYFQQELTEQDIADIIQESTGSDREKTIFLLDEYGKGRDISNLMNDFSSIKGNVDTLDLLYIFYKTKLTSSFFWEFMYYRVKGYKNQLGCCVPYNYIDKHLVNWITHQKDLFSKNLLKNEHAKKLEAIGFTKEIRDKKWNDNLELLAEYYKQNGNCSVPYDYTIKDTKLGEWVYRIKNQYKKGLLQKEKIELLRKINFNYTTDRRTNWDYFYDLLKKYKETYGDCRVPINYEQDNFQLGRWVSTQKTRKEKLSEDRIKKLDELGIVWSEKDSSWEEIFKELLEYKEKHGNLDIKVTSKREEFLNNWMDRQRIVNKKNKLSKERFHKLNELNFKWDKGWNKSGIKGVILDKKTNRWRAYISINKKQISLGYHEEKIKAIEARKNAEIKYLGKSDINLDDYKGL